MIFTVILLLYLHTMCALSTSDFKLFFIFFIFSFKSNFA